jgi:hypothetical protein
MGGVIHCDMNTKMKLAGWLMVAALGCSCAMVDGTADGGTVQVNYENPEKFTDMSRYHPTGRGADESYMDELRDHLQRAGSSRIPAGDTLAITITDGDLAGEFEPHRGPTLADVRIIRSMYAPRINLTYRLTDASGAVRAEGDRVLRNPTFDWTTLHINRTDPLRYEKDLLDEFLSEVARSVKSS